MEGEVGDCVCVSVGACVGGLHRLTFPSHHSSACHLWTVDPVNHVCVARQTDVSTSTHPHKYVVYIRMYMEQLCTHCADT